MKTNAAGVALIKQFEGCRLEAYLCPAGVWTIGYGHTGPDVKPGMVITQQRADELLVQDLQRFESGVDALVTVPLLANQFAALVSFSFNLGVGALQKSTLLKLVNQHKHMLAAAEFLKWNKAGGVILRGLTLRRQAEGALYSKG